MSGYRELGMGYNRLVEGSAVTTGQRVFDVDPLGTDDLPELEDPFDAQNLGAVCINRSRDIVFIDEDDNCYNGFRWTCSYSTVAPFGASAPVPDDNPDQRTFTVGGEVLSVVPTSKTGVGVAKWHWTGRELGTIDGPQITDQTIYVSNPVGLITFSKDVSKGGNGAFKTQLRDAAGRLNAGTFEGFPVGNVMFVGASGNLHVSSTGTEFWKYILSFKWRVLGGKNAPDDETWQYLWNSESGSGKWAIAAKDDGKEDPSFDANLYNYYNLNSLLPGYVPE